MSIATLEHVSFAYGEETDRAVPGLADVDLTIGRHDAVLLCGCSGCGKSTLLRTLNGLVPHFHTGTLNGSVEVAGLDPTTRPLYETGRLVATVFQNPRTQFFTTDTTSELAFAAQNAGVPAEEIFHRIDAAVSELGCTNLVGRDIFRLSGGEKQRIACAASLVARPQLYLFDEPTSNLSPEAIEQFRSALLALRSHRLPLVIAEHRLHYLRGIITKAVIVDHGRVLRTLPAREFWQLSDDEREAYGLRSFEPSPAPRPHLTIHPDGRPGIRAHGELPPSEGLELRDIRLIRGRRTVLSFDRLVFPAGRITAIVGDNGVGKSSLLHAIAGLLPCQGTMVWHGRPHPPAQRIEATQIVMQDVHRQLFAASVAEELTLGLSKADIADLDVPGILREHGLDGLAERHPMSLSGGQKQRLVIAIARAARKRIHLFDEPSSGLDRHHLDVVANTLRSLARRGDVVILVTHDRELLHAAADQIVSLHVLTP